MASNMEANARAHRSLAETRVVEKYLDALDRANELRAELTEVRDALPALEKQFIKVAKSYAARKAIDPETFVEYGVRSSVLREAGLL